MQHLLRYRGGQFVNGERGHRVLWALVNTALVHEMSGKGYVVHKMFMRRVGFRLEGGQSLRVRDLRQLVGDGGHSASLVNQLMCVGRSVRSTPMQWSYESKKLDCAAKFLSWRPPYVRSSQEETEQQRRWRLHPNYSVLVLDDGSLRYVVEDNLEAHAPGSVDPSAYVRQELQNYFHVPSGEFTPSKLEPHTWLQKRYPADLPTHAPAEL